MLAPADYQHDAEATLKTHTRIYLLALVIFVVGSISGTLVYLLNTSDSDAANSIIGNPQAYNDQLERIGGRSAVFADQFNRWLTGLWHGERLGITLVVLVWVARQMERDDLHRASRKIEQPRP
jgi:ABC-type dipeptide/oligopeptide/nickel transport system permease component